MNEIETLVNQKSVLEQRLSTLISGSIEIRDNYIYIHKRENGKQYSKYIGEYTDELHNLLVNNNILVKEIKKELREINSKLKKLNYQETTLNDEIKSNIDFAKKNLVHQIYNQAILEGITTTFADTENIVEGGKISNMSTDDVLKINNLKHAWQFILSENVILSDSNFALLSEINKLIEEGFYYNAGKMRTTPVSIGGTAWKPELPIENEIKDELNKIVNKRTSHINKAIELMLFVSKKQIFIDGNKRTALIFANHYLISKGIGIITIPIELVEEYKKLLIKFYEGNNQISKFLKENCFIEI